MHRKKKYIAPPPQSKKTKRRDAPKVDHIHAVIGLEWPEYARDKQVLRRVLPEGFDDKNYSRLLKYLESVAVSFDVRPRGPNWLAETMFHLALEHTFLGITKRGRGKSSPRPVEIEIERRALKLFFRMKAKFETTKGRRLSRRKVVKALCRIHDDFYEDDPSVLFPKGLPQYPEEALYDRISQLMKNHPDIVADYESSAS